jgi:hypothetical protein
LRATHSIPAVLVLLALAGGGGSVPAGEPFLTRNQSPVSRLYGVPVGEAVGLGGGTGWPVRVVFEVANLSFQKVREDQELVLDGETWSARLVLGRVWAGGWRTGIQIPFSGHGGGGLDDFIEDYHRALGLPYGNRRRRPGNRLEYVYRQGEATRFRVTEPTAGLGDVQLFAAAPIWRDGPGARAVDAVVSVELPTGDADRLLGSGSTDLALGRAGVDRASLARWRLELPAAVGVVLASTGDLLSEFQEHAAGYGRLSLGWRLTDWLQPRLQVDWHGPFFAGTGLAPLDSAAAVLVAGATIRLPAGLALEVAVAEDIDVNTAADVVFHLCLKGNL